MCVYAVGCKRWYTPSPASRTRLVKQCEKLWITHNKHVIQSEFAKQILSDIANRVADAQIAVQLMQRVDDVQPLLKGFENFVTGIVLRDDFYQSGNAKEFVYGCWRLHLEWTGIVSRVFYGDLAFVEALDRAFIRALNGEVDACVMISKFADGVLKKSSKTGKGDGDLDMDGKLDVVVCDDFFYLDYAV
jgi:hypothetical protein